VKNDIAERLLRVQREIEDAASSVHRDSSMITIMAVSKTRSMDEILRAREAGVRLFGENRVQEARDKLQDRTVPKDAVFHLIGHLQRNKAKYVPGLFSCVQSLDAEETAVELDKRIGVVRKEAAVAAGLDRDSDRVSGAETGVTVDTCDVLIQCDFSGEETKSGIHRYENALDLARVIQALPCLVLRGVMTIGPNTREEDSVRAAFRKTAEFFHRLKADLPEQKIDTLSMGMSADYRIAVEEGSTMVRIGTGIFGLRG
jgi:PLP dependent protein